MADRFTDKDYKKEQDYLQELFKKADKNITLPESLKGKNLLHLLEDVTQEPKKEKKKGKTYFLSWQAFVTYAAMFAIIFTLFMARPKVPEPVTPAAGGDVEVVYQEQDDTQDTPLTRGSLQTDDSVPEAPKSGGGAAAEGDGVLTGGDTFATTGPETSPTQDEETTAKDEKVAAQESGAETFGVGGGSQAYSLGHWKGMDITWRSNDPTDPDKENSPVTVELVDLDTGESQQQIDIKSMSLIEISLVEDNSLVFAGSQNGEVTIEVYHGDTNGHLSLAYQRKMPGSIYLLKEDAGVLYAASTGNSLSDGWESIVLKDSGEEGVTYLMAQQIATGDAEKLSLQGLSTYVTLEGNQFVIHYQDSSHETRTAVVRSADNSLLLENESKNETK